MLPATRQRWFSRLYPQRIAGTHLSTLGKDERLSWPRWLVIPRLFTQRPSVVTHPSSNRARRRVTTLMKTNGLRLSQATNYVLIYRLVVSDARSVVSSAFGSVLDDDGSDPGSSWTSGDWWGRSAVSDCPLLYCNHMGVMNNLGFNSSFSSNGIVLISVQFELLLSH